MKCLTVTLYLYLVLMNATAQDCSSENVQALPGKWKPAMKGSTDHTAADMVKERALLSGIIQTLQNNFTWKLQGGDITFNDHVFSNSFSNNPMPFWKQTNASEAYIFFQHYFCSSGKVYREDYFTQLGVLVNQYPFKFSESFFIPKVDANGNREEDPETNSYLLSSTLPNFKDGYWEFYQTLINGNKRYTNSLNNIGTVSVIYRIISKPGAVPYLVMTKKEYYEGWIAKYHNTIAGYDKQIALFRNSTDPNLEAEDRRKNIELDESLKKSVVDKLNALAALLKSKTTDELLKPAISGEEEGVFYATIQDPYTQYYVLKPNYVYYDSKAPKWKPQLFTIVFRTGDMYNGQARNTASEPDKNFVMELKRMGAIDLLTQYLQPMLK